MLPVQILVGESGAKERDESLMGDCSEAAGVESRRVDRRHWALWRKT